MYRCTMSKQSRAECLTAEADGLGIAQIVVGSGSLESGGDRGYDLVRVHPVADRVVGP